MEYFPIFLDRRDQPVLIVGALFGGLIAGRYLLVSRL